MFKRLAVIIVFIFTSLFLFSAEDRIHLSAENLEGKIPQREKAKKVWMGTKPSHYLDLKSNTFLRIFYSRNVAVVGKMLSRQHLPHVSSWEALVNRHLSSAYNIIKLAERGANNSGDINSESVKIYDYTFSKKPGVYIERLKQYFVLLIFGKKFVYIFYISFLTQSEQIFAKDLFKELNRSFRLIGTQ